MRLPAPYDRFLVYTTEEGGLFMAVRGGERTFSECVRAGGLNVGSAHDPERARWLAPVWLVDTLTGEDHDFQLGRPR